jgi:ferritin-like metal-binding protein YciE
LPLSGLPTTTKTGIFSGTIVQARRFDLVFLGRIIVQKTLKDLFIDQLKDIYFAEKQIYKTLPKLVKAAESEELKTAFTDHRTQTEGHIKRLESVFEMLGKSPQAKTCEAIKGIMIEGDETMKEFGESEALDAGLVASGQAVEHYEMARYGTLIAWAKQLAMPDAAKLLAETLKEEKAADQLLTKIGDGAANKKAAAA